MKEKDRGFETLGFYISNPKEKKTIVDTDHLVCRRSFEYFVI